MIVSTENGEHYVWGEICDGWHLVKRDDMSVIQESVPAGAGEVRHYHHMARQFFYVLDGQGALTFDDQTVVLEKGQGIEIPPQVEHQFKNLSNKDVHFLVISIPSTRGDRMNL